MRQLSPGFMQPVKSMGTSMCGPSIRLGSPSKLAKSPSGLIKSTGSRRFIATVFIQFLRCLPLTPEYYYIISIDVYHVIISFD